MINSLQDLRLIFNDTFLNDRHCIELPILETEETAFAREIQVHEIETSWNLAHKLLDQTGRYPIVSTCWQFENSFTTRVHNEDFFSRFYFQEMDQEADLSPRSLIQASESVNVECFLDLLKNKQVEYDRWEDIIQTEIQQTAFEYGSVPSLAEITDLLLESGSVSNRLELNRWLWSWESAHYAPRPLEGERFEWFEPDNAVLLLLPTASSWETLAYLHWYGAYEGAKYYIALGKSWEQRFGATLVAHYGTILQCIVSRPPQTPEIALALAVEQDLVAPCTLALPGLSLRHYAQGLLNNDRWFLHERP